MNRRISFQTKLFIVFSMLIAGIIISAFSVFYWYYQKVNIESMVNTFRGESQSLAQQLDNSIYTMDRLVMQMKFNPTIANTFYYLPFTANAQTYFDDQPEAAYKVKEAISSIVGVDPQIFHRVSILSRSGAFLATGAYYDRLTVRDRLQTIDWFRQFEKSEYRLLLPPHRDDWDSAGKLVVSVIRKLGEATAPNALIEIQLPYDYIETLTAKSQMGGKRVLIAGGDGQTIYPFSPESGLSRVRDVLTELQAQGKASEGETYVRLPDRSRQLVVYARAPYSGWTVMIVQPEGELLRPQRQAGYLFAATGLIVIVLTMLTSYFSAKMLVKPLRQLRDSMNRVQLDSLPDAHERLAIGSVIPTNTHNELHHLHHSFRKMLDRLEASKEEAILSRSRELQAHFTALQAQIHPHFLYNTLSLIGVLGQEAGNREIVQLTAMLADMFRYMTYSAEQTVTLRDEIQHTKNYLNIMKFRYEAHLQFTIDIPQEMLELRLPKLSLQPFVENCFKHGFASKRYPWRIDIRGALLEDGRVAIEIRDDGAGFPSALLERFGRGEVSEVGMEALGVSGLYNTYSRLQYQAGGLLEFSLDNDPDGGAIVLIHWLRPDLSGERARREET
ncbi:HAMP domain-containing protein [Paenibacillus sp. LMG 31461]|uniref:HAMP domain-containing protein n=1 Tax=Paenibacillus plantarum TaxID=2654975 RepID=A0ABX1X3C0_9BACL|nr:sensor histidine kinase [Paenibacillus plantarum]NOU62895.1 HAMP domain-containing protein [Paenibacillus plantarum]